MPATDGGRFARREKGTSLVLVLMFATTIASFCLFSLASAQGVYKTAKTGLETTRAFYLAEGGADYALSQLSLDPYWAATATTDLPTVQADGSFESGWLQLGHGGGVFKVNVAYAKTNTLPKTWTGTGFPPGFVALSAVTFPARTDKPTFDRMLITTTGRYNGVTRTVRANVKAQVTVYSGAIISDATQIPGAGSGKGWSIAKQTVVMDGAKQYVWGGIRSNAGVYLDGSATPITAQNAESSLTHFSGELKSELEGTSEEIPDFTNPGSTTQLFDFGRFKAAAAAGAGAVYTVDQFVAAMNTANAANVPLEGIIYVTVDASHSANLSNITGSKGINIKGTLVFHFVNVSDAFYKVVISKALNINAAPLTASFDPMDSSTFSTGYPPTLSAGKDPRSVDITGAGYTNFGPDDDLPALMFDTGTVDIHGEANVSGVVYGPSFIEIENHNDRQYFNGALIGGAGIYIAGNTGSGASQVFVHDPAAVDALATFANVGKTPVISAYVVGK
jgi:hypothetical protein